MEIENLYLERRNYVINRCIMVFPNFENIDIIDNANQELKFSIPQNRRFSSPAILKQEFRFLKPSKIKVKIQLLIRIDRIRDKYDPLSNFVRPHITLVFPFESDISSDELNEHIKAALLDCSPFNLTMERFTASVEPWSNYLFLNVTDGLQNLYQLSRGFYTGVLEKYQSDIYKERYCPHLTVGNLNKKVDYQAILASLRDEKAIFTTIVNCVSVEIIGNDESSIIEMSISL